MNQPLITGIDHVVLTVADVQRSVAFYERVLGVEAITFGRGRRAILVGGQKVNLQPLGQEDRNRAAIGSGDICLLTPWEPEALLAHLAAEGVDVIEGPVAKAGARGEITSVYFLDPDRNLIEVASYTS